ncbi:DUF6884 domain-containing protein [Thermoactinospora rubra]|uniref:DUF6884 domain-containing protein n=1 Tax=Thermoactinospora rubra TaxID=1088767 RepID=UPI000A1206B0|nr:DUF6884 domain-containing protein [Thermoactinospora rubra]
MNLVIVGCSRRKRHTGQPVPALDLYEGGCIPRLRQRISHLPELRARVRILSAEHGLIDTDRLLMPYDRVLTPERALELRPLAATALSRQFTAEGLPEQVLVVAEPLYQLIVWDQLHQVRLHLIDDPRDWAAVAAVLDAWGWP